MRRLIPEVGALYERVRRPATTILIGLALVLPAAGVVERSERAPEQAPAPEVAVRRAEASGAMAGAALGPVAQAWREKALEREREKGAAEFARQFGIPLGLAREIHSAALKENIDPKVAFGLVRTESSFRRTAVSHAGAVGYTQLLPSTARWIAPGTSRSDLFDTRTNLRVGFRYLRYLLDKYNGDVRLALTAYNRGPGTVDRSLRQNRNPENGYADKVLAD